MWLFNNSKTTIKELFIGFTDHHSHILPGVDDGVKTIEKSLEILHRYEELGVKSVWLTPHIMEDTPNTTAHLKERFAELQSVYDGGVRLHLSAEYMLDCLFEERLDNNDLLPMGDNGNHLLVETSYFNPPVDLQDKFQRIFVKGYNPILAHPERYMYMDNSDYTRLKEMGVKFQLNVFSLKGVYGNTAKKKAIRLLDKNCYDYIGTDLHRFDKTLFADPQKYLPKNTINVCKR